jgi:O-antigen/teichoic acid export membrane protein
VRQTLHGAALLSAGSLALNAVSVPALAFIIRRLGSEGYAQWTTASSLLALCGVITNPGLRGAFVRAVAASPDLAGEALAEQLGVRLVLTVMAGAAALFCAAVLGYGSAVFPCVLIGAAGLGFTCIASTLGDVLQAVHKVRTVAGVGFVAGLALTIASVVAAWLGRSPVAVAAAYLVGPAVSAAVLAMVVHRRMCPVRVQFNIRRGTMLIIRARHLAAQQLLAVGSSQAEALMLPRLLGMGPTGVFSAGAMIPTRLAVVPDALCTAGYPAIVRRWGASPASAGRVVLSYLALAVGLGILISAGVMVIALPIGRVLFPADPAAFRSLVSICAWSLPLVGVEMVLSYALNAAGRDASAARALLPAGIVSLSLSVAGVLTLGLVGACISMVLRPAVRAAFLAPVALRTFRARANGSLVIREPVPGEIRAEAA